MASRLAVSKSMGWFLRHHLPGRDQLADQVGALHAHRLRQLGDGDGLSIRITFLCSDISVISVCFPFFALFFLWPRTGTYAR